MECGQSKASRPADLELRLLAKIWTFSFRLERILYLQRIPRYLLSTDLLTAGQETYVILFHGPYLYPYHNKQQGTLSILITEWNSFYILNYLH